MSSSLLHQVSFSSEETALATQVHSAVLDVVFSILFMFPTFCPRQFNDASDCRARRPMSPGTREQSSQDEHCGANKQESQTWLHTG
jgi:hypothetical protein